MTENGSGLTLGWSGTPQCMQLVSSGYDMIRYVKGTKWSKVCEGYLVVQVMQRVPSGQSWAIQGMQMVPSGPRHEKNS